MKKIFAILLTLVMVISMFTGCDVGHDHEHDPTTEPTEVITDPTGDAVVDPTIDETEAPIETTVPETEAPTEAETEVPTEAPTEPEATECKHDYEKTVVAPTQSAQGYTLYKCKKCGDEYKSDYTAKLPSDDKEDDAHKHSYSSEVTKTATCTTDGVMTFTCSCGASYTETIAKTGHSWGNWVVTKEPTTEAEGEETRTCGNCGKTETRKTDKLPADDGGDNGDDEGGYYWFGNIKKPWNCATQGHHVTNKDRQGKCIQNPSCIHDEIWEYTCDVVGCGATWTENKGGAGGVAHKMSAADQARITKGDYFYSIRCRCGHGNRGSSRDEALAAFNAHAESCPSTPTIVEEREGHYHNFPSSTFVCTVCQQNIAFSEAYAYCDEC